MFPRVMGWRLVAIDSPRCPQCPCPLLPTELSHRAGAWLSQGLLSALPHLAGPTFAAQLGVPQSVFEVD